MTAAAVVSVAFGPRHEPWLDRLFHSLDVIEFAGARIWWRGRLPPAFPVHSVAPYGFKIAALEEAGRRGHDLLLWLDASIVVNAALDRILTLVSERGVLLFANPPHKLGEWCSDAALPLLGFRDREEAMTVPECCGTVVGLDLKTLIGREFLRLWRAAMEAGAFAGTKWNKDRAMSRDPRVKGHRHDQTAAGAIARRLNLALEPQGELLSFAGGGAVLDVSKKP
jgi:hypothetical protein